MKKWSRVARRWTAVLEVLAGVPQLPPALSQEMSAAPPQPAPSPASPPSIPPSPPQAENSLPGWLDLHS